MENLNGEFVSLRPARELGSFDCDSTFVNSHEYLKRIVMSLFFFRLAKRTPIGF